MTATSAAASSTSLGAVRRTEAVRRTAVAALVPGLGVFTLLVPLAAANGGYFPTAWGWSGLALSWAAALAVVVPHRIRLGALELAAVAALALLLVLVAASTIWSESRSQSVVEIERTLVYPAGVLAVLLVTRTRFVQSLLAWLLAAIALVSVYALGIRLFPERLGVYDPLAEYRLGGPLGYWNALGIFAAIGLLLALGFAARSRRLVARAVAGALPVPLSLTLYFTFSRGAWIALFVALAAALALDPRRLQLVTTLLVVSGPAAIALWVAFHSSALTHEHSALADASRQGHRLAGLSLGLAAVGAALGVGLALAERRLKVTRPVGLAYAGALVLVLVVSSVAVFVRYGSPVTIARHSYEAFTAPTKPVPASQSPVDRNLNTRLFSLWGNGRPQMWRVAWQDFEAHPWLGSGAGSFEQFWHRHRPIAFKVRDAHSLYAETLAELGPVGLALVLTVLGVFLAAGIRARRHPLVPAVFGAVVAYIVHAGVDWDWEMPAVTLAGLFCGAALLVCARSEGRTRELTQSLRVTALALLLPVAAFAFVGLIGNSALAASREALGLKEFDRSEAQARKAIRWAPWSADGWSRLADAQLRQRKEAAARASLREAIARDPHDWGLWYDLARASHGQDRSRSLAQAQRLDPLGPEIASLRADIGLGRTR
jgi:hypothetical protein